LRSVKDRLWNQAALELPEWIVEIEAIAVVD
jgi:hypothetical protein